MTRLFTRGALLILAALLLSFVVVFFLAHHQTFNRWKDKPPEGVELIGALFQEASADLSDAETDTLLLRMKELSRLPLRIVPVDSNEIADDVRTQLQNEAATVRNKPTLSRIPWLDVGLYIYAPTAKGDRILIAGPLIPETPELSDWLQQLFVVLLIVSITALVIFMPLFRRLRVLEAAARRIADGDLGARAHICSRDAVGSLADTFNNTVSRLQELLENQRHLVQAVAHELRTPIARVRFGIEMMEQASDPQNAAERRKAIESDLAELDRMVEELLLYSRYDSGKARLSPTPFEPVQMVHDQFSRLSVLHPGLEMTLASALDPDDRVTLDPASVERVMRNLIDNAARYAQRRIEVRARVENDALFLEVHDDGPGIPATDRDRILEPFVRLDDSRSRASGGVGLGLAIVARILRSNGGSISIEQSPLQGAGIVTIWPLSRMSPAPDYSSRTTKSHCKENE